MIGADLLRYQDQQRYLLLDCETESLNLARTRPWQIAYAICSNKGVESVNVRYPFWADLSVSDEAARITRFDKADYLARAEDPSTILTDLETLLLDPSYLILGHNILGFDHYVLATWRRLCGRPTDWSWVPRTIDTLCLSRAYRFQIAPDRTDLLSWQYKMLTIRSKAKGMGASLGAMAREFGIEYDERRAHDAQYDTTVNHEVFKRLIWEVEV